MPDRRFFGKPEISRIICSLRPINCQPLKYLRPRFAGTTLALKVCLASWCRKNGSHQLDSFPCHTINHMASEYRSYLNDWDTCRKCSVTALLACVVSTKLSILLQGLVTVGIAQLRGARRWAEPGSGASPATEPQWSHYAGEKREVRWEAGVKWHVQMLAVVSKLCKVPPCHCTLFLTRP